MPSRREFLKASLQAGLGLPAARLLRRPPPLGRPLLPDPRRGWRGDSSLAAALRAGQAAAAPASAARTATPAAGLPPLAQRFPDLRRHFVFEYYPWFAAEPYRHWDQWDRVPPTDLASNYLPLLGAYDSRSAAVLERHARWIADAGAGAVNLSWWGPDSFEDRGVPLLMDVMRDHGLKVAFHLEPYADDHALRFAGDVLYLLREYGENRGWDAFLLLRHEDGKEAPVFKAFRTILPETVTDCHGLVHRVPDFASDSTWRRQNLGLRRLLRQDFERLTLLADSLDFDRVSASGFDGVAIYDNFVPPAAYASHAQGASRRELAFSFNVNPGYDGIEPRRIEPGSCYSPTPFAPADGEIDWARPEERERAAALAAGRVAESLEATLAVQTDPSFANAQKGFFLVYVNSFNEWHEGHAFEPMKGGAEISTAEWTYGYHNPGDGGYRIATLRARLAEALAAR